MRWPGIFSRTRREDELAEELSAHIEFQTRKHMADGIAEPEARRRARIEFGAMAAVREECREARPWRVLDGCGRNLKHCFRSLKRSPAFVCVAVAILAICIASNIAVFSVIDGLFLRSLPVKHPNQLVRIASLSKDGHARSLPSRVIGALKGDSAFQGLCGVATTNRAVEIAGGLRQLGMAYFTGGCFDTLGIPMQLGRGIKASDDWSGAEHVAVITDSLWHSQFGGRPDVLGKTMRVGDRLFTIVGVTKKGFSGLVLGFPEPVMIPLQQLGSHSSTKRYWYWVNVLARRAAVVSLAKARANVAALRSEILAQSVPPQFNAVRRKAYLGDKLIVQEARGGLDYFLRSRFGEPLYAILGLCAAMLLMAGVNLTTLLLARSLSRHHEIAIRLALGASRMHIAGIFVLENAVLLLAGTMLGAFAGMWAVPIVLGKVGQLWGNFDLHVGPDVRVISFLVAAFLLIIGMFTAASICQATRFPNAAKLKQSGRGVIASNRVAQKTLLATQIALTLALVAGAALFAASIRNTYRIDLGINPRNVWAILLGPRPGGYDHFTPRPYYRDLVQQIQSLPGVVSVSAGHVSPFMDPAPEETVTLIDGAHPVPEIMVRVESIGDHFFKTMGSKGDRRKRFRRARRQLTGARRNH
ncbi:MAG: ABC transporter permease [Bryobacteraceae bacterium]